MRVGLILAFFSLIGAPRAEGLCAGSRLQCVRYVSAAEPRRPVAWKECHFGDRVEVELCMANSGDAMVFLAATTDSGVVFASSRKPRFLRAHPDGMFRRIRISMPVRYSGNLPPSVLRMRVTDTAFGEAVLDEVTVIDSF